MLDGEAVTNRIKELIQPLLASRRAELVELSCHFEGSRVVVRCLADTARGITLDELSDLNRAIGALLEEHDVIQERYMLEVSSPGLDRPLKTPLDFERVIGRRLKVACSAPVASRREHSGELLAAGEELITLRLDSGEKVQIPFPLIAWAKQEIDL